MIAKERRPEESRRLATSGCRQVGCESSVMGRVALGRGSHETRPLKGLKLERRNHHFCRAREGTCMSWSSWNYTNQPIWGQKTYVGGCFVENKYGDDVWTN